MVQAQIARSSSGISDAFEARDLKTITIAGGLAAVGFAVASSVGVSVAKALPGDLQRIDRVEAAVIGLGAFAVAALGVGFLPDYLGGPLAIGSMVAVGMAALMVLLGPVDTPGVDTGGFRKAMAAQNVVGAVNSASPVSLSGCATCGQSQTARRRNTGPAAQSGEIRDVGQEPVSHGFR